MEKKIYFNNKVGKLFFSQKNTGEWVSSILYYDKNGCWSKKEEIVLDFKVESFVAGSEDEVERKAIAWFSKNVTTEYKIE